jgi:uncharacterized protein
LQKFFLWAAFWVSKGKISTISCQETEGTGEDEMMREESEAAWLAVLENELAVEMEKAPAVSNAHNGEHIRRVWRNAGRIGENLKVDWDVVIAAAFLHDLGRHYPEGAKVHGPISAPLARQVLERIHFPAAKIDAVIQAIYFHDETFTSQDRSSLEAKVLYDADKLDAFGAIGVARSMIFYTTHGKTLAEITEITRENLPLRFHTLELDESRSYAAERFEYVMAFFARLRDEL